MSPIVAIADLRAELHSLGSDEASAWRRLAALWHVDAERGDPCAAALRQQVRCYKFAATLPLVRSLDRPGFLTLRDDAGKSVDVVLIGFGSDSAVLAREDGGRRIVPLTALGKAWQGEFGTLWHLPPGYSSALGEGASGPLVDRLAMDLARIEGASAPVGKQTFDAELRAMVIRFQKSHGLSPVGKAGPTTFMQLNRATGVDEPRLLVAGSAH
jgi:general secretion pathway protein A